MRVEEHGLHRVGLELFDDNEGSNGNNGTKNGPLRRRILLSLGERLLTERRGEAALAVFLSAGERRANGGVRRATCLCGDWRSYFTFAVEWGEEEEEKGEGGRD